MNKKKTKKKQKQKQWQKRLNSVRDKHTYTTSELSDWRGFVSIFYKSERERETGRERKKKINDEKGRPNDIRYER